MRRQSVWELRSKNLHDVLNEVERIARQFQSEIDRDYGSDESRVRIGGIKRQAHERLQALLREAAPEMLKRQYWRPGLMAELQEIWLNLPAVIQGESTWLAYLGNIRQLLLHALAPDSATGTAAPWSEVSGVTGKPQLSIRGLEQGPKGCWRVRDVAERWNVAPKTVLRKFRGEPNVIHLKTGGAKKGHTRERDTLLIPASVLERAERLMSVPDKWPAEARTRV